MASSKTIGLLDLPAELLFACLSHLDALELARISSVCRQLCSCADDDRLWKSLIQQETESPLRFPPLGNTYRSLFKAHHAHWFLTRHQIWFSDSAPHGQAIIVRYDDRRGCVEGYALTAELDRQEYRSLEWDGVDIRYHSFHPRIDLDLNRPIVHLGFNDDESASKGNNKTTFISEVLMDSGRAPDSAVASSFLLARAYPNSLISSGSTVWPPQTVPSPADQRVLNQSGSRYQATGHHPVHISQICQSAFRIRQWLEYSRFIPVPLITSPGRAAEQVFTYGTIDPTYLKPTNEKPWQGLWVGDYAGHGPEFVVIIQPDKNTMPLPPKARKAFRIWPRSGVNMVFGALAMTIDEEEEDGDGYGEDEESSTGSGNERNRNETTDDLRGRASHGDDRSNLQSSVDNPPYRGSLMAIKLTGDPHVPRGELTFIANDLGSGGYVCHMRDPVFAESRESHDPNWKGARVVKSVSHVAEAGFMHDCYLPSHLIMINNDCLAQFWHTWSHFSFFKRVDVDALLKP